MPISEADSAGPPRGIRLDAGPVTRCSSRLSLLFPGRTSTPLRPPFKPSTAWVWIAPFLLLLVGVFVAVRIVRKRSSMVAGDDSVVETEEPPR